MADSEKSGTTLYGLKGYKPMNKKSYELVTGAITRQNGPAFMENFLFNLGGSLEWRFGVFTTKKKGQKMYVYPERVDSSGHRVGRPINPKAGGPGEFDIVLFGPLAESVALTPGEAGKYAEAGKITGFKWATALQTPETEGFNADVYSGTARVWEYLREFTNERLVKFLTTERYRGQLVGELIFPGMHEDCVREAAESGITDQQEVEKRFIALLGKEHRSSTSVALRIFNPYNSLRAKVLEPSWDEKNSIATKGTLSDSDSGKLAAWRKKYAGDPEHVDDISEFIRCYDKAVDFSRCHDLLAKWEKKFAYSARWKKLLVRIRDSLTRVECESAIIDDLRSWSDECIPNTEEVKAIDSLEKLLYMSVDPDNYENPRHIRDIVVTANGTPISLQELADVPKIGAPVALVVTMGALLLTTIGATTQATNVFKVKAMTIFQQGLASGSTGNISINAGDLICDDDDDDDGDGSPSVSAKAVNASFSGGVAPVSTETGDDDAALVAAAEHVEETAPPTTTTNEEEVFVVQNGEEETKVSSVPETSMEVDDTSVVAESSPKKDDEPLAEREKRSGEKDLATPAKKKKKNRYSGLAKTA